MRLTRLDLFLWAAGFVLTLALLVVLCYHKRFRSFPFFTALMAFGAGKTIALYTVRAMGSSRHYFFAYWSLTMMDALLQLCVVYEVAAKAFRPLDDWASDLRGRFAWMAGLSMVAALSMAWMASPAAHSSIEAFATKGSLFADALMSELFVAMTVISVTAGMPWRSHAGAIARGLGAYSLFGVLIQAGHAYFGVGRDVAMFVVLYQLRMVAYLGCISYWIVNLATEEEPARVMTGDMRAELLTLQTQMAGDLRSLRFRKSK